MHRIVSNYQQLPAALPCATSRILILCPSLARWPVRAHTFWFWVCRTSGPPDYRSSCQLLSYKWFCHADYFFKNLQIKNFKILFEYSWKKDSQNFGNFEFWTDQNSRGITPPSLRTCAISGAAGTKNIQDITYTGTSRCQARRRRIFLEFHAS